MVNNIVSDHVEELQLYLYYINLSLKSIYFIICFIMIALLQKLSKILEGEKCWKWYTNFVLPLLLMLIINISTRYFHHRNIQ